MSNLSLVPETGDEMPSQQIARRVRGVMAEHQISGRKLAEVMHIEQGAFSRRYKGKVAWSTDELAELARLLNRPFSELCAIRDSNPEPADLGDYTADLRLILGLEDPINETGAGSDRHGPHDELES